MNNQELQLVSYTQANLLKQVGFNWKCTCYYDDGVLKKSGYFYNYNDGGDYCVCSAPTVALALKWCRTIPAKDQGTTIFYNRFDFGIDYYGVGTIYDSDTHMLGSVCHVGTDVEGHDEGENKMLIHILAILFDEIRQS